MAINHKYIIGPEASLYNVRRTEYSSSVGAGTSGREIDAEPEPELTS